MQITYFLLWFLLRLVLRGVYFSNKNFVMILKKEESEMEATHVADRKATYLCVYVRSLYLYVDLVKCKRALPCLIIL